MKTSTGIILGVGAGLYAGIGLAQKTLCGENAKTSVSVTSGLAWPWVLSKAVPMAKEIAEAFK